MEGLFLATLNTMLDYNLLADVNGTFVQLVNKTNKQGTLHVSHLDLHFLKTDELFRR